MAPIIDHVLALLPFEPPYMQAAGMTCDFVGHPVVAEPLATPDQAAAFRASRGIAPDAPLILALPGSRKGEVSRLGQVFGEALAQVVAARHPTARVVVPTVRGVAEMVREMAQGWPGAPVVVEAPDAKRAAFGAADAALAASGTVSLELAAAGVPMVIAYDFNWLSRIILRRLVRLDTVTLVNLVTETRTVPEFIGERCRPALIAPAVLGLLAEGPDACRPRSPRWAFAWTASAVGENLPGCARLNPSLIIWPPSKMACAWENRDEQDQRRHVALQPASGDGHTPRRRIRGVGAMVQAVLGAQARHRHDGRGWRARWRGASYTNNPSAYPTSGTKVVELNVWTEIVLERRETYVANTLAEIATVFPDHALIGSLGLGSVINMPILLGRDLMATLNLLDVEGYFTPSRVKLVQDH